MNPLINVIVWVGPNTFKMDGVNNPNNQKVTIEAVVKNKFIVSSCGNPNELYIIEPKSIIGLVINHGISQFFAAGDK